MKCLYCKKELEKELEKAVIDLGVEPYCSQYCAELHGACAVIPGSDSEKDSEVIMVKIDPARIWKRRALVAKERLYQEREARERAERFATQILEEEEQYSFTRDRAEWSIKLAADALALELERLYETRWKRTRGQLYNAMETRIACRNKEVPSKMSEVNPPGKALNDRMPPWHPGKPVKREE